MTSPQHATLRTTNGLPALDDAGIAHHQALSRQIQATIAAQGGFLSFEQFMQAALYTPHLGYYSGHANKFGVAGDFVTAPEISPLFAQTLATQVAQCLHTVGGGVLELGAGTGKLASGLLLTLAEMHALPTQYAILEVSANLRARQQEYLQAQLPDDLYAKIVWLEQLPSSWTGVILGNEVLDAIPVQRIQWRHGQWHEVGLCLQGASAETHASTQGVSQHTAQAQSDDVFEWATRPLADQQCLSPYLRDVDMQQTLPEGYETEICPAANALIASLANCLQAGLMLWVDYGFCAREFYHPQRHAGTLMCHFQQRSHDNPLIHLGLQDITAHVDFTAIAETGLAHGLQCAGYTTQAQFLVNCGILAQLGRISPEDPARYLPAVAAVQKLLSPAEMGELFKVIALTKGLTQPLLGFSQGDKRHQL